MAHENGLGKMKVLGDLMGLADCDEEDVGGDGEA